MTDANYEAVLKDIRQEAEKYGPLEELNIPRPNADLSYKPGVGKVGLASYMYIHIIIYIVDTASVECIEVYVYISIYLSCLWAHLCTLARCFWCTGT